MKKEKINKKTVKFIGIVPMLYRDGRLDGKKHTAKETKIFTKKSKKKFNKFLESF